MFNCRRQQMDTQSLSLELQISSWEVDGRLEKQGNNTLHSLFYDGWSIVFTNITFTGTPKRLLALLLSRCTAGPRTPSWNITSSKITPMPTNTLAVARKAPLPAMDQTTRSTKPLVPTRLQSSDLDLPPIHLRPQNEETERFHYHGKSFQRLEKLA
jgi:hypothetical protein